MTIAAMATIVVTREQILAVRNDPDSERSLVESCDRALRWIDIHGMLDGYYTDHGDRVRWAIASRIDRGLVSPTTEQCRLIPRWARPVWRVWCMWSDMSQVLVVLRASDSDDATQQATRMGLVAGICTHERYRGLHATTMR